MSTKKHNVFYLGKKKTWCVVLKREYKDFTLFLSKRHIFCLEKYNVFYGSKSTNLVIEVILTNAKLS